MTATKAHIVGSGSRPGRENNRLSHTSKLFICKAVMEHDMIIELQHTELPFGTLQSLKNLQLSSLKR